jgi:hypothetical protein
LSNLGTPCDRKLWYTINTPEKAEAIEPHAQIKFLFGDILEELLLFLSQAAGHSVEGTQDKVNINGVEGSRDAVIDGVVVDVKSASSFSFKKFEEGLTPEKDGFGYLTQLRGYLFGSKEDPLVKHKDIAAFLAIDKQLGKITLDIHGKDNTDFIALAKKKQEVIKLSSPPPRAFSDVPYQKSGNRKLGVECSYCSFKETCWPGVRTFFYSQGPVHLTQVVKEPKVNEPS